MHLSEENNQKNETYNLAGIIDKKIVQSLQDFFAQSLGLSMVAIRNNEWLTESSNPTDFCRKYIRKNPKGCELCEKCHRKKEKEAIKKGEPVDYICHAGLTNFVLPIFIDDKYIASVLCGQFLTEEPDKIFFIKTAQEMGLKEKEYLKEISKMKIVPKEKVAATKKLLYLVANTIATTFYVKNQLTNLGLEYKLPKNAALEDWISKNLEIKKKDLTSREYEILRLIVQGKNNNQIAKKLFISVHTVKAHITSILEKFEVEDRVQLAVKVVREGLF